MVRDVSTLQHFNTIIAGTPNTLIVVAFKAEWCGYCKAIGPTVTNLENEHRNVVFINVDVDKNRDILSVHTVKSLPTFIFFKNGNAIHRLEGANAEQLKHDVARFQH